MTTKIESYQQLKEAKLRSKRRIELLEQRIRENAEDIKNDLKPLNLAGSAVRKMLTSEKHGIVSESLSIGVNALVKGLLFRRTGFITKTLIAFAAKNLANNMVSKNSESILDWLQVHLRQLKSKHHSNGQHYDASTANADLDN